MTPDAGPVMALADANGRPAADRLRLAVAEAGLRRRVPGLVLVSDPGGADVDAGIPPVEGAAAVELDADLVSRRLRLLRTLGWVPPDDGYRVGPDGVRLDEGGPAARVGPPWLVPAAVDGVDVWAVLSAADGVDGTGLHLGDPAGAEAVLDGLVAAAWRAAVERWAADGTLAGRSARLAARLREADRVDRLLRRRLAATREELAERIVSHEELLAVRAVRGRRRRRR